MRTITAVIATHQLLALTATALVIFVIPGPSVLFIISRGVTFGRRAGLATVVGNEAGLAVQVIGVAAGLGALVERSIRVFTALKLIGAAYLVYLGVQAFRHRRTLAGSLATGAEPASMRTVVRQGFFVGVSNPKSIILFTAILPQFVDRGAGHVPVQLLLLGALCVVIALASDSIWALVAGTARSWFGRRPERLSAVGGAGGLAIVALGVRLAVSGRND
jgi:threonine/homoserine/homoserine lactone efflux protein